MPNVFRMGLVPVVTRLLPWNLRWQILLVFILAMPATSGAEPTTDQLIEQLTAKSARDRRAAAEALGRPDNRGAIAPLIACLQDKDRSVSRAAAMSLVKIGQSVVEPLIACLNEENAEVRRTVVQLLGQLGDKRAVGPLITSLGDTEGPVRGAAADALGRLGEKQAAAAIAACLKDKEASVRRTAAEALGRLGEKQVVDALAACLKDEETAVRRTAVQALGQLGVKRAAAALAVCLKDEDAAIRRTAVQALGQLGDKEAVTSLTPCLKDDETTIRTAAADVLGRLGDRRAVPHLVALLPDWQVNQQVTNALRSLKWEPATDRERLYARIGARDKDAMTLDWEVSKRLLLEDAASRNVKKVENAIYTLISLGRPDMIPDLVKILDACDDPSLCETYLNCGHPTLINAGRRWAIKHEYSVTPGPGGTGPSWGAW